MSSTIKQFFVMAAVLAIVFVFVIQFRPGTNVQTKGGPQCMAEVRGHCIPEPDYVAAYRLIAPPRSDSDTIKALRLQKTTVDGLIERWLLVQDAQRLGISVSDEDLTRQLGEGFVRVSLPAAGEDYLGPRLGLLPEPVGPARDLQLRDAKTQKFDQKRYERTIREYTGMTPRDFREFQRQEMIAARMRELVRARVRVSDAEAREQFNRERKQATVDYVKFERTWYAIWIVDWSDATVQAWAAEHKDEVEASWTSRKDTFLPECRVARHILAKVDPNEGDVDEAKKKAKETLEKAQKRLEAGESFEDLAKELSDDPGSKLRGGDLGCIGKGKAEKSFEDALYALEEGKMSGIVETGYGLHLIRLDVIAKDAKAEELGRLQVARELYVKTEAERLAAEGGKQILSAVQGGKTLTAAVQDHVDTVLADLHKREAAAQDKGKGKGKKGAKGEAKKPEAKKPEAKKPEAKKPGEDKPGETKPGEDKPGEKKPGGQPEPEQAPTILTALTDPAHPHVETSLAFTISGPPFAGTQDPAEAAKTIFAIDKPGQAATDLVKLYDGYAAVVLKDKTLPTEEDWQKDRTRYLDGLRREKQRDALVAYVQELRRPYAKEITYGEGVLEKPEDASKKKDKDKASPSPKK